MADAPYGVYVSLRDPDTGALVSINRANWQEASADLQEILGDEFPNVLVAGILGNFQMGVLTDEIAEDNLVSMLGATEPATTVIDMSGKTEESAAFERCEKCSTLKDKWNQPGLSRSGKRYQGFYGCPNFRNHS